MHFTSKGAYLRTSAPLFATLMLKIREQCHKDGHITVVAASEDVYVHVNTNMYALSL